MVYSNKNSFVLGIGVFYTLMLFYLHWSYVELNNQISKLNDKIMFVELRMDSLTNEIDDLERGVEEITDRIDILENKMSVVNARITALETEEDTDEQIKDEVCEGEIEMLAQLIEAEAGNQDFIGKCLVADVVLNRVESDIFPDNIEDVINEKHYRKKDGVWCYQFSTVKYGTFEKAGWNISADSLAAARQEYESERLDDRILYFTAFNYNPCCIPAYVHGDHYFGY